MDGSEVAKRKNFAIGLNMMFQKMKTKKQRGSSMGVSSGADWFEPRGAGQWIFIGTLHKYAQHEQKCPRWMMSVGKCFVPDGRQE